MKILHLRFSESVGETDVRDFSLQGNNGSINPVRVGATPARIVSGNVPQGYRFNSLAFDVDDMPPSPTCPPRRPLRGAVPGFECPEPDEQLQFLSVPVTRSIQNINQRRQFTISFWAYHTVRDRGRNENSWVLPETPAGRRIFCPQHVCGANAFYIFIQTKDDTVEEAERGQVVFTADGPEVVNSGDPDTVAMGGVVTEGYRVPLNQWVHIAGVLEAPRPLSDEESPPPVPADFPGSWRIYVDGILRGQSDALPNLNTSMPIFRPDGVVDIRFGNFRGANAPQGRPNPIKIFDERGENIVPGANDYAFNGYLTGIRMYDHAQGEKAIWDDILEDTVETNKSRALFYTRGTGEGEFVSFNDRGQPSLIKRNLGWRRTWDLILRYAPFENEAPNLLFYDKVQGQLEFVRLNSDATVNFLTRREGSRRTWHSIIPGDFGAHSTTDLLFYDKSAGEGEFYRVSGTGLLRLLRRHTLRRTWDLILQGNFTSGPNDDLLFYDRESGTAELYRVDGDEGEMRLVRRYTDWGNTWDIIFVRNPSRFPQPTDLIFYERETGTGEIRRLEGEDGRINLVERHTNWRDSWDLIIPAGYTSRVDDLLFYEKDSGTGEFGRIDQYGGVSLRRRYTTWRTTWNKIIPGNFDSASLF